MKTEETHREYLQRMAAEAPFYPYRVAGIIGGLVGSYWLGLFVMAGVTIGLPIALALGYLAVRACTWEVYAFWEWKQYGQHD